MLSTMTDRVTLAVAEPSGVGLTLHSFMTSQSISRLFKMSTLSKCSQLMENSPGNLNLCPQLCVVCPFMATLVIVTGGTGSVSLRNHRSFLTLAGFLC